VLYLLNYAYNINILSETFYIWDDLWEFDTNTNQWFWLSGSSTSISQNYSLGLNASISPLGRFNYAYYAANDGLWIYGGSTELGGIQGMIIIYACIYSYSILTQLMLRTYGS